MKMTVFVALGLLVFAFLCVWLMTYLRYQITPRHLKITLFGLCLRRIALNEIESVSKRRPSGWAENWWSTLRPNHRMLVIRRRCGLRKHLLITPKNRYIFKADLERAIAKGTSAPEHSTESAPAISDYPREWTSSP